MTSLPSSRRQSESRQGPAPAHSGVDVSVDEMEARTLMVDRVGNRRPGSRLVKLARGEASIASNVFDIDEELRGLPLGHIIVVSRAATRDETPTRQRGLLVV